MNDELARDALRIIDLLLPLGSFVFNWVTRYYGANARWAPSTPFREFPFRCFIYLFLSFSLWCFFVFIGGFLWLFIYGM